MSAEVDGMAITAGTARRPAWRPPRRHLIANTGVLAHARVVFDVALLAVAALLTAVVIHQPRDGSYYRMLELLFPIVAVAVLYGRARPEDRLTSSLVDTVGRVLAVLSVALMASVAAVALVGGTQLLAPAAGLWLLSVTALVSERVTLGCLKRRTRRLGGNATPTLIVGAGATGVLLARRLLADPSFGLRPVGFLDADPLSRPGQAGALAIPVLGSASDLVDAIELTGAGRVILAFSSERDHLLVAKVKQCEDLGIDVSLIPRLYESLSDRATLDHVGGLPLLTLHAVNPRGWQFGLKYAIDRGLASALLVILAPLLGAITLAVRLSSPGPVFFRQLRVGRDGREFYLLKFRTMRTASGASTYAPPDGCAPGGVEGADRRTVPGRWLRSLSLDELPQLLNVIRGEMSLIGPRPERPEFVARFAQDVARYDDRHRVKSGITGWAQVHGLRGQTSIADRVEWDNYYIRNWSLLLDLRIAALTVAEIIRRRG